MSGKAVARRIRKAFNTNDPEVIAEKEGLDVMAVTCLGDGGIYYSGSL